MSFKRFISIITSRKFLSHLINNVPIFRGIYMLGFRIRVTAIFILIIYSHGYMAIKLGIQDIMPIRHETVGPYQEYMKTFAYGFFVFFVLGFGLCIIGGEHFVYDL